MALNCYIYLAACLVQFLHINNVRGDRGDCDVGVVVDYSAGCDYVPNDDCCARYSLFHHADAHRENSCVGLIGCHTRAMEKCSRVHELAIVQTVPSPSTTPVNKVSIHVKWKELLEQTIHFARIVYIRY